MGARVPSPQSGSRAVRASVLVLALAALCALGAFAGQEERKHKVPVINKITSGPNQQAFSGTVQSLDLKRALLNVNTVQGGNTEIFPIRKGTHVSTADGGKLKLATLTPGTNVLIYYEQKGDRRTVKDIVVLGEAPAKQDKKSPPPS
jgi:hypothetical protein